MGAGAGEAQVERTSWVRWWRRGTKAAARGQTVDISADRERERERERVRPRLKESVTAPEGAVRTHSFRCVWSG